MISQVLGQADLHSLLTQESVVPCWGSPSHFLQFLLDLLRFDLRVEFDCERVDFVILPSLYILSPGSPISSISVFLAGRLFSGAARCILRRCDSQTV